MVLVFKFLNLFQGHLPFVVVSSIAVATTLLVLATDVESQIGNDVVLFVAVAMVYGLIGAEWSSEVFGHNESVFGNYWRRWWCHGTKKWQVFIFNVAHSQIDIATACYMLAKTFSFCPSSMTSTNMNQATRATISEESWLLYKLTEMPERIPSLLFACWTSNTGTECSVSAFVQGHHAVFGSYRWMMG